jgi:hypothetical protein
VEPGVHQEEGRFVMDQRAAREPPEQFIPVRCLEDGAESVGLPSLDEPFREGQKMQIVVSEDANDAVPERADPPEDLER